MFAGLRLPSSLDTDAMKTFLVAIVGAFALLSILSAWFIRAVVTKIFAIALCLIVGTAVWVQRGNIADCADNLELAKVEGGDVRCDIAGFSIKVPTEKLPSELQQRISSEG